MFLGIDLGTSSVKAVLIDHRQKIVAESSTPLTVNRPQPLFSEQSPEDWWTSTNKAIQELDKKHLMKVEAIGLSGQMHGATLLSETNAPLRPAILWNDGRSFEECSELRQLVPQYKEITGNLLMPGFTAPKLLWVKKHEPEIFSKIAKVLLPKDYLRYRMSGVHASDMSDSAGTSWLNVKMRKWSTEMLSACDLIEKQMPELFEGTEVTSQLSDEVAKEWNIPPKTPIVGGGGDNAASAIICGVISHGNAFLSLGTSGVYFVSSNEYKANPEGGVHTFCHCIPNLWHHMSVHLSSASCLDWFQRITGIKVGELFEEVEKVKPPMKENLLFLPYLSGIRTPYNDPHAKSAFFGMTHNTKRSDLMKAILEGVAFDFADGQSAMTDAGINVEEVSVIGGGARSAYWGKILATILKRDLSYREGRTVGAAMGAARLAWFSTHKGYPEEVFSPPPLEKEIPIDKEMIYETKRKTFQKLYPRWVQESSAP